mmetsp:Transcript_37369/g.57350  ORF Transcript_37369/g.57350 Transcript_37369/m.57350 type:complete len:193 (+) Transcript_37369:38-616(+)
MIRFTLIAAVLASINQATNAVSSTLNAYTCKVTCDLFAAGTQARNVYESCSISTVNLIISDYTSPPSLFRLDQVDSLFEDASGTTVVMSGSLSAASSGGGAANHASSWGNDDDDVPIPDYWRKTRRLRGLDIIIDRILKGSDGSGSGSGGSVIMGDFKDLYEDLFMDCLAESVYWHHSPGASVDCTGSIVMD